MSEYKDFLSDVTKIYAEDTKKDPNIEITIHAPETHGTHDPHSQINFIDRDNNDVTKFRIPE